jgi:hypothetical protein
MNKKLDSRMNYLKQDKKYIESNETHLIVDCKTPNQRMFFENLSQSGVLDRLYQINPNLLYEFLSFDEKKCQLFFPMSEDQNQNSLLEKTIQSLSQTLLNLDPSREYFYEEDSFETFFKLEESFLEEILQSQCSESKKLITSLKERLEKPNKDPLTKDSLDLMLDEIKNTAVGTTIHCGNLNKKEIRVPIYRNDDEVLNEAKDRIIQYSVDLNVYKILDEIKKRIEEKRNPPKSNLGKLEEMIDLEVKKEEIVVN